MSEIIRVTTDIPVDTKDLAGIKHIDFSRDDDGNVAVEGRYGNWKRKLLTEEQVLNAFLTDEERASKSGEFLEGRIVRLEETISRHAEQLDRMETFYKDRIEQLESLLRSNNIPVPGEEPEPTPELEPEPTAIVESPRPSARDRIRDWMFLPGHKAQVLVWSLRKPGGEVEHYEIDPDEDQQIIVLEDGTQIEPVVEAEERRGVRPAVAIGAVALAAAGGFLAAWLIKNGHDTTNIDLNFFDGDIAIDDFDDGDTDTTPTDTTETDTTTTDTAPTETIPQEQEYAPGSGEQWDFYNTVSGDRTVVTKLPQGIILEGVPGDYNIVGADRRILVEHVEWDRQGNLAGWVREELKEQGFTVLQDKLPKLGESGGFRYYTIVR